MRVTATCYQLERLLLRVHLHLEPLLAQDFKRRGEPFAGPDYLGLVVPPVLNSLVDADAHVRYYACEALYNIAKVRLSVSDGIS